MSSLPLSFVFGLGHNQHQELGRKTESFTRKFSNSAITKHVTVTKVSTPIPLHENLNFISIAAGSEYSLFLNEIGEVWVSGNNTTGQLGIDQHVANGLEKLNLPEPISEICTASYFDGMNFCHHSAFLSRTGSVYVCGFNITGELGIGKRDRVIFYPVKMDAQYFDHKRIKKVICGSLFKFFVTADDKYYCCGLNVYGQLGLGHLDNVKLPVEVNLEQQVAAGTSIVKIKCGNNHSLFLTKDNKVYAVGNNRHNQLALLERGHRKQLTECNALSQYKIVDISAQGNNSLFLTSDGEVFGAGYNEEMQLSDTHSVEKVITKYQLPGPAAAIHVGLSNSMVIMRHAVNSTYTVPDIYVCGANGFNQLGLGAARIKQPEQFHLVQYFPRDLIPSTYAIEQVALGNVHTMLLMKRVFKNSMLDSYTRERPNQLVDIVITW